MGLCVYRLRCLLCWLGLGKVLLTFGCGTGKAELWAKLEVQVLCELSCSVFMPCAPWQECWRNKDFCEEKKVSTIAQHVCT